MPYAAGEVLGSADPAIDSVGTNRSGLYGLVEPVDPLDVRATLGAGLQEVVQLSGPRGDPHARLTENDAVRPGQVAQQRLPHLALHAHLVRPLATGHHRPPMDLGQSNPQRAQLLEKRVQLRRFAQASSQRRLDPGRSHGQVRKLREQLLRRPVGEQDDVDLVSSGGRRVRVRHAPTVPVAGRARVTLGG